MGGLGGIGRSVCQWLAQRGAKNIIVLSRSANAEKIRPFAEEMQHLGCKIYAVASDISDSVSMARALEDCRNNMPPVRGVIQGAMVLQVCNVPRPPFHNHSMDADCKLLGFHHGANDGRPIHGSHPS